MTFVARQGDFDFLVGRWVVTNRKLRERLALSSSWDLFDADYQAWTHLDGAVSVDEFNFRGGGPNACTLRTLDRVQGRWSIYWVTAASGSLGAPVHGGWLGDNGEFYGDDVHEGRPIEVRFRWRRETTDVAHWEQAFRPRAIDAWETNWTMTFRRVAG